MSNDTRINLLGLDRQAMEAFFVDHGYKAFHGRQVLKWIHKHGVVDFDDMTDISKALRGELKQIAKVEIPEVLLQQTADDGTKKWLLDLGCGNRIESVFIPDDGRNTLCVSSQAGCALDCSFCSTAQQGFNRNLSSAEIVGQVWLVAREVGVEALTNIVLMGMGEPLTNFDNVVAAMDIMQDDLAYGLSKHRVTLSTAGIVPALYKLREVSDVCLAVSLHAPDDELRNELVPINRKYPIAELLKACKDFIKDDKRRKVTFEYVMLDGVNDSDAQARRLVKILNGVPAKVNLIPFNPFPNAVYRRSPDERIMRFQAILMKAGIITMTRKTRGDDIDAACGQLVGKVKDRSRREIRVQQITGFAAS